MPPSKDMEATRQKLVQIETEVEELAIALPRNNNDDILIQFLKNMDAAYYSERKTGTNAM